MICLELHKSSSSIHASKYSFIICWLIVPAAAMTDPRQSAGIVSILVMRAASMGSGRVNIAGANPGPIFPYKLADINLLPVANQGVIKSRQV